ncbi:hypothetical protein Taro_008579 [Colocasia esculenta]|uniref:Uncharacterized protein n=1 Tax=Colocasia esculenta TaxID=4460 RepID=A0A843TU06_COLES|nr:hypothetical protein [Colocasia esculenta]
MKVKSVVTTRMPPHQTSTMRSILRILRNPMKHLMSTRVMTSTMTRMEEEGEAEAGAAAAEAAAVVTLTPTITIAPVGMHHLLNHLAIQFQLSSPSSHRALGCQMAQGDSQWEEENLLMPPIRCRKGEREETPVVSEAGVILRVISVSNSGNGAVVLS